MNAKSLFQTIQKLKACVEVLVKKENSDVMPQIQNAYFHNATIFENEKSNDEHNQGKSKIIKFLERDERIILK